LEYLGEPVPDASLFAQTVITEDDADEYDAPSQITPLSLGAAGQVWAETVHTRDDSDTYDNDVSAVGLDIPLDSFQTVRTAMSSDTYDNDVDLLAANVPGAVYDQTSFTKVQGETTDDDNSGEGLSFPSP